MTRAEILMRMVESIQETLTEEVERLDIQDIIDEDDIDQFMWNETYGKDIAERYIEENLDEIKHNYLKDIYDEIKSDDLESPF